MGMEEGSELMGNGEGGQNSWVMKEGSELMGNGGGVRTHGKWRRGSELMGNGGGVRTHGKWRRGQNSWEMELLPSTLKLIPQRRFKLHLPVGLVFAVYL